MKEYIERTAVLNLLEKINPVDFGSIFDYKAHGAVSECLRDVRYEVEYIQAADVAPVRHGYWYDCGSLSCRCSKCGCKNNRETAYCPNCGARMDKENETGILKKT